MMRSGDLLIAAAAVVALSLAASPVPAGAEACPTPVPDHIPAAPLPPLNLGTIKDLLLEYHQKYYDIDVAAVFDSAQKYIEQNAAQSKRPVTRYHAPGRSPSTSTWIEWPRSGRAMVVPRFTMVRMPSSLAWVLLPGGVC